MSNKIEVTLNMLPDLLAIAALLMLSAYHLMIYWGRKQDKEEEYNLFFAIFVFAATLFIIAPYFQPQYFFYSLKPTWLYVINMEALMMLVLFYSGIKFLNRLLNLPHNLQRYFNFTFLTMPLNFLLTLTSNFISTGFYFRYILPYVLSIVVINILLAYSVYGFWMYRERLYKKNFFRVLYFGFVLLTVNILIYRGIELLNVPMILYVNHYVSAIILYIFAYALSVKFNSEYFELKELKADLEMKVTERTEDLKKANKQLEEKNAEIEIQKEEIVSINEQLSFRANELATLDEAKSRFFAGISHEFRTPLTLIIGPLESLLPQAQNDKLKVEYGMMLRQAKRLLELINQLLELSKLQKGMMVLDRELLNFNRLIRTIVSTYSSLAHDLGITLHYWEESSEQTFSFDRDKVEKIMTNLLTNALKFTPRFGEVDVIVNQSIDQNFMEVSVRDTGSGIAPPEMENIFNPFYQVDPGVKHGFEGSGIGLALVKELVELHQGSISVKSDLGEGTIFQVKFPIENENKSHETHDVGSLMHGMSEFDTDLTAITFTADNQAGKKTILVAEDNVDMRYYIRSNLPTEYHIIEATNGQEAFDQAYKVMPDLIITDIMMPVMNGLELTSKIKQDERLSHTPVIMLTAKASNESKVEGLHTQADDYVTKPFNMEELILRIRNLIASRQKLKEKFSKSITVNPSEIVTTSIDERFLQSALQVVERNMDESEFNAEQFCEEVGMSRAHVHRKLKALTDQSTTEFIRTIRLKRAAQFLKQNAGSVSEVAYKTGFNNLSYFTRCFKEEFGTLPSEYSNI